MQAAEAELLYIKEVEKLDGFGQESFPAKVDESLASPITEHTHQHFFELREDSFLFFTNRTTIPTIFSLVCPSLGFLSNTEMADPSCSTSKPPTILMSVCLF